MSNNFVEAPGDADAPSGRWRELESWRELERRERDRLYADQQGPIDTINPVIDRDGDPFGSLPAQPEPKLIEQPESPEPPQVASQPVFDGWIELSVDQQLWLENHPSYRRCQCGHPYCTSYTKRTFAPGHDAKMISWKLALVYFNRETSEAAYDHIVQVSHSASLGSKFRRALYGLYDGNPHAVRKVHETWDSRPLHLYGDRRNRASATEVTPIDWVRVTEVLMAGYLEGHLVYRVEYRPRGQVDPHPWCTNYRPEDPGSCDRFATDTLAMEHLARARAAYLNG